MRAFLISALFVLGPAICKAQSYNYIQYPDFGMTWIGYSEMHAMGNSWYPDWNAKMGDNVVIRNQSYLTISNYAGDFLYAYIRKDSAKRVYYILASDTTTPEMPLYDFALNRGDTLYTITDTAWVTLVDTPLYLGIPRRTLHVTHTTKDFGISEYTDSWIEGIGSTAPVGIFSYSIINHTLPYSVVTCTIEINMTSVYANCNLSGIVQMENKPLSCFPNPASSTLNINLSNHSSYLSNHSSCSIQIYNYLGQLKLQENSRDGNRQITIAVQSLTPGIYTLKVTNSLGEVGTVPFIKSD